MEVSPGNIPVTIFQYPPLIIHYVLGRFCISEALHHRIGDGVELHALTRVEELVLRAVHVMRTGEQRRGVLAAVKTEEAEEARGRQRIAMQFLQPHEMLALPRQMAERNP